MTAAHVTPTDLLPESLVIDRLGPLSGIMLTTQQFAGLLGANIPVARGKYCGLRVSLEPLKLPELPSLPIGVTDLVYPAIAVPLILFLRVVDGRSRNYMANFPGFCFTGEACCLWFARQDRYIVRAALEAFPGPKFDATSWTNRGHYAIIRRYGPEVIEFLMGRPELGPTAVHAENARQLVAVVGTYDCLIRAALGQPVDPADAKPSYPA